MSDRHAVDPLIDFWIGFSNIVTALIIGGGLIGAFVIFGDALFGSGAFETETGWLCLGFVGFAYLFRRVYPPVCRYIWESFK